MTAPSDILARSLRRPEDHLVLADLLEENPHLQPPCDLCECGHGKKYHHVEGGRRCELEGGGLCLCGACFKSVCTCQEYRPAAWSSLPLHRQPVWQHRVLWPWVLRLRDERWHGVEKEECCRDRWCAGCGGSGFMEHATFALLFDRPKECDEDCSRCSGEYCDLHITAPCECDVIDRHVHRETIPGHLSELAADLRAAGAVKTAERVGELHIGEFGPYGGIAAWAVLPSPIPGIYYERNNACRELIRRVCDLLLVQPCTECNLRAGPFRGSKATMRVGGCPACWGLGEVARELE